MISIITIVKNDALRIEATMRSVLAQKMAGVEYIVIDGASTDGTLEKIKKHESEIDVIISEKDSGIYQALNKGIRSASGTIIGIVHCGDVLLPDVLGRIALEHEKTPEAILYGCVKAMLDGHFESVWGWSHDSLPKRMLPHPACFVPVSIYSEHGVYDETYKVAGDYEAFLRYYSREARFHFVDLIVQEFDVAGISQTINFNAELMRIRRKYRLVMQGSAKEKARGIAIGLLSRAFRGLRIILGK